MTRLSKCATERTAPLDWHFYRDADGYAVVARGELGALLDANLPYSVQAGRFADFKSLIEDAALGRLNYSGDVLRAVARDPDLWELRWYTEDGAPWRMYHAEPDQVLPGHLLSLRIHEKDATGSEEAIRDRQNDHIQVASDRYRDGESRVWGL